jgi:hypothetical protein
MTKLTVAVRKFANAPKNDNGTFPSDKNPSLWNFLSPEPEVTCGTVAIIQMLWNYFSIRKYSKFLLQRTESIHRQNVWLAFPNFSSKQLLEFQKNSYTKRNNVAVRKQMQMQIHYSLHHFSQNRHKHQKYTQHYDALKFYFKKLALLALWDQIHGFIRL